MLGHASAAMTLDRYADLFEDDLDYVATALSRARSESIVVLRESTPDDPFAPGQGVALPPRHLGPQLGQ
jgi:hypothetical protein